MKQLFVVLLLFNAINLNAQWNSVGPWGGDIYGIGSNNSGLYALTTNTIYKSTDNGNTWSGSLITINGVSNAIYRNSFYQNDNFAVNNYVMLYSNLEELYVSTDNGLNWTSNNLISPVSNITFKGNDIFIIAEYNSSIYRSTNYGLNWIKVIGDLQTGIRNDILTYGNLIFLTTNTGIYKTSNNGLNWVNCFNGYAFKLGFNLNYVYANVLVNDTVSLYKTSNGGTNWIKSDAGLTSHSINKIHTKDNYIYVSTSDSGVYKSTNFGTTWKKFNNGFSYFYKGFDFANSNNYVITGSLYSDGVYKSLPNDTNWLKSSNRFSTLDFECFARSGSNLFAGGYNGLYFSTDGGSNWQKSTYFDILGPRYIVNYLYNVDKVTYQALFISVDTLLYRSTNSGANWQRLSPPLQSLSWIESIYYINNTLFIGGTNNTPALFKSTDLGLTWQNCSSGINNNFVYCYLFENGNLFIGTGGGVYISNNMGANWYERSAGLNGNMDIHSIISDNGKLFISHANGIYSSTNLGVNWVLSNNFPHSCFQVEKKGTNIYSVYDGGVFMSTNSGTSWIPKCQGLYTRSLNKVYFDAEYVYLLTSCGGIWRRLVSNIINITNISTEIPSTYSLGQNYPNPFNSSSKFKFEISKLGIVKIVVYDIQGREVQTLVNERLNAGTYETTFDGSMLTSGVYFYKLNADGFAETKMMVLIK